MFENESDFALELQMEEEQLEAEELKFAEEERISWQWIDDDADCR